MGVYIPKMEMPRNCSFCPCARMNISRNGIECSAVDFYAENLMPQKERMKCCPLVEVKPHGDLIDRDALSKSLDKLCDRICQYSKAQRNVMCSACPLGDAFIVVEDDAPTIIEAEGEE